MKAWVAYSLSLMVFVTAVDEDITVVHPDIGKLKLFLPNFYITRKTKYLFNVVCSKYYIFEISELNVVSV